VDPRNPSQTKPEISYGKVSYDFKYSERIMLKNSSLVPFTFTLRIQNDLKGSQNEFKINPQFAEIGAKEERTIEIEFIPRSIKKYETVMTIDIDGVGADMLSIPIRADCQVPNV
jgi:hypothetical protein